MANPKAGWVLGGAIGMALGLLLIVLIVVITGSYNVAATDRHNPVVAWALTTTMENSVESRAGDLAGAPVFTPAMVEAGAGGYKAMCAQCHGGVGESQAIWARTMQPMPPPLAEVAPQWSAKEIFWIVKHGVKMTGMPAFAPTHNDQTVWEITAFVKQLPQMNKAQYAAYEAGHGGEGHKHGNHQNPDEREQGHDRQETEEATTGVKGASGHQHGAQAEPHVD